MVFFNLCLDCLRNKDFIIVQTLTTFSINHFFDDFVKLLGT